MISLLISIPFILLFNFHLFALKWSRNRKILHFLLQMFSGVAIGISFFGPLFLSLCLKDCFFERKIFWYSSAIIFVCNMIRFFIELFERDK